MVDIDLNNKKERMWVMFFADMLAGIANLFSKSVSSACICFVFDEPSADNDIL